MLDNIRDRGTKKWTAMMLPEHLKELRIWENENKMVKRPELEEFELTLIAEEVERAHKK